MKEDSKDEKKTDTIKFVMGIFVGIILYKLIFDVLIPMFIK